MAISTRFRHLPNLVKRNVARIFDAVGINSIGLLLQRSIYGSHIRAINYHVIDDAKSFENQLRFYSSSFTDCKLSDLSQFLKKGTWPYDKPGLIISFDDAHSTHFETAAPLLEEYGFTGWFFTPADAFRGDSDGKFPCEIDRDTALSIEQLKHLDENHVVGSHSSTHVRLSSDLDAERLEYEIKGSLQKLEGLLGRSVETFCWVGGEEYSYSADAAALIRQNYSFGFMTNSCVIQSNENPFQLQRTNIESNNPLWLVRFQLSGLMDMIYSQKRKRVNKLTG